MTKFSFYFPLSLACWLVVACAQSSPPFVYRADLLSPDDVKLQGGFFPKGEDGTRPNQPPADISLYNHVEGTITGASRYNSGYVSTSTSLAFARRFVRTFLGGRGYIYKIHPSANFIDVAGSLGRFYQHPDESEVAVLGRVHYSQITGWARVRGPADSDEDPETSNPDYDTRFDLATWGGSRPELAGFPEGHRAYSLPPWKTCEQTGKRSTDIKDRCRLILPSHETPLQVRPPVSQPIWQPSRTEPAPTMVSPTPDPVVSSTQDGGHDQPRVEGERCKMGSFRGSPRDRERDRKAGRRAGSSWRHRNCGES